MTRAALGTSKSGRTNTRLSATKFPRASIRTLGDRRINSTASAAEIFTRDDRTRLGTDCGPRSTANGNGRLSESRNLGSENQADMTIPMSSYARTSLLYSRTLLSKFRRPRCCRVDSIINFFEMSFSSRNANVAVNRAIAPCCFASSEKEGRKFLVIADPLQPNGLLRRRPSDDVVAEGSYDACRLSGVWTPSRLQYHPENNKP